MNNNNKKDIARLYYITIESKRKKNPLILLNKNRITLSQLLIGNPQVMPFRQNI